MEYRFKHGLAEERNSFTVVKFTVYVESLEVILVINEVIGESAVFQLEKSAVLLSPSEIYIKAFGRMTLTSQDALLM